MHITTCFSYDEIKLVLSQVRESIAVRLKSDKDIDITVTLHPMQCKIFGEALVNAAGRMQIGQMGGALAGSMQVEFNLENQQEDAPCRQQDLSVPMDKECLSRIA